MSLAAIRDDFDVLDDWEDRYRYVIELGRELAPIREDERTDANKVRGCASQVWLVADRTDDSSGAATLRFRGDSDAHIVRGLIAILLAIMNDKSPSEILATDVHGELRALGLEDHLTPQRSNGLKSMIERIRATASAAAG